MTRYVALLRAVNLGGRAKVGMPALRELFADAGHTDVVTYIQSGNVVFAAGSDAEPAELAGELERALADRLGVPARVLLRTAGELAATAAGNPYLGDGDDQGKLHVTFLAVPPDAERVAALAVPEGEPDRLAVVGTQVYLHCPQGYGRSKLSNAFLERRLGVVATTRNWRTVLKLDELARG